MADLAPLDAQLTALVASLGPTGMRRLTRRIAIGMRKSQAEHIAAQKAPDGTAFEPRKPQPQHRNKAGRIKAMFERLRTYKHLRISNSDTTAEVGFTGRDARLARVHQEGLIDAVNRRGLKVRYPVRTLLGFSEADRRIARDAIVDHLSS